MTLVSVPGVAEPANAADELRTLMRHHPAGVVVITAGTGAPTGFCATSFTSVSLDPPTVAFAVSVRSSSGRTWAETTYGIVHVLRGDQREVALAFARSGPEKFARDWRRGPCDQPLLDGVSAWLLVEARERVVVGDHLLVVANVVTSSCRASFSPLVYHDGAFYSLPT